jgi:hypothetical protein
VPILLLMGGAAAFVWLKILGNSDNLAQQRRDQIVAALTKADD